MALRSFILNQTDRVKRKAGSTLPLACQPPQSHQARKSQTLNPGAPCTIPGDSAINMYCMISFLFIQWTPSLSLSKWTQKKQDSTNFIGFRDQFSLVIPMKLASFMNFQGTFKCARDSTYDRCCFRFRIKSTYVQFFRCNRPGNNLGRQFPKL
jgi:hypothetical protein